MCHALIIFSHPSRLLGELRGGQASCRFALASPSVPLEQLEASKLAANQGQVREHLL